MCEIIKIKQFLSANPVHAKKRLVLRNQCVFRLRQNLHQHFFRKRMERNDDRKPPDKLRNHPKLDQITSFNHLDEVILFLLILLWTLSVVVGLEVALRRCPTTESVVAYRIKT